MVQKAVVGRRRTMRVTCRSRVLRGNTAANEPTAIYLRKLEEDMRQDR
jgi:hypothetical protein